MGLGMRMLAWGVSEMCRLARGVAAINLKLVATWVSCEAEPVAVPGGHGAAAESSQ